jgi:hypothetical protein
LVLALLLSAGSAMADSALDKVQGNWEGNLTGAADSPISAKIIAQGDNSYKALVEVKTDEKTISFEMLGRGDGSVGVFWGRSEYESTPLLITARAVDGKMVAEISGTSETVGFQMNRVEKKSPTLGAPAPQGAVVLFDGTNEDKWKAIPSEKWNLHDGVMTVSNPYLQTMDEFGSGTYHVEFMTPLMPSAREQGRGNSGVYLLGRYEVQVLDSYGNPPADNEAGGIYKQATPLVNAALPPQEWQTYDITFTAAKFDASGKKTDDARITAKYNGVLIHDNVALKNPTPGGVSDQDAPQGPLMLQNHGNAVSYRNIWFQPAP